MLPEYPFVIVTRFVVFLLLGPWAGLRLAAARTAPPGGALPGGAPACPPSPGMMKASGSALLINTQPGMAALSVFTLSRRLCAVH